MVTQNPEFQEIPICKRNMQVVFDKFESLWYIVCIKAAMKTRGPGKIPREDATWCKASEPLPRTIPLLSCVCGNATPGAPVTVPMSDGKMP